MLDKKKIRSLLIEKAQEQLNNAQGAYLSTASYKSDPDMQQEGKYDTRSIESGQLAGAQAKRVEELKLELQMLQDLPLQILDKKDQVAIGALVYISLNQQKKYYFISPTAGGTMLNIDDNIVLVISVFSPIGHAVLGLNCGDVFEIGEGDKLREYKIIELS